jgi:hypothetical protein
LLIEAAQAGGGILDRVDGILEDDLLRRVLEGLAGEPTPMPRLRCFRPLNIRP